MIPEVEVGDEIVVDRYVGRRYEEGQIWRMKVLGIRLGKIEKIDLHSGYDIDCAINTVEVETVLLDHYTDHAVKQSISYGTLKRLEGFRNIDYENRLKMDKWKAGLK